VKCSLAFFFVGPAIAVMWGWLPALLWVVFGSIFIGAVHDLGSIVVSLRNKGRSIGDIAGDLLGPRVRLIFIGTLIIGLWIVLAVFGLVIAAVLKQFPGAIFPFLFQIPLAVVIGIFVHRKGRSIVAPSIAALALMYVSVFFGDVGPLHTMNQWLAAQPTWAWTVGLLAYAYVASVLPVWVLLQPRDYINALQLLTALGLLVAGVVVAGLFGGVLEPITAASGEVIRAAERVPLEIVAPTVDWNPPGAPPLIPILFITVACGAISGFHCLVGSGTTSKQIEKETHAKAIGYGSILTEGFLAVLVIVACAAGLGLGTQSQMRVMASSSFPVEGGEARVASYLPETILANGLVELITVTDFVVRNDDGWFTEREIYRHELATGPRREFLYQSLRAGVGGGALGIGTDVKHFKVLNRIRSQYAFWDNEETGISYVINSNELSIIRYAEAAFNNSYRSWARPDAMASRVQALVAGTANLIAAMGIPRGMGVALMGVLVASLAGTTLTLACRLQRGVIQAISGGMLPKAIGPACAVCGYDLRGTPLAPGASRCPECGNTEKFVAEGEKVDIPSKASAFNPFKWLATVRGAALLAVVSAALLAGLPAPGMAWSLRGFGSGAIALWPIMVGTLQIALGLILIGGGRMGASKARRTYLTASGVLMVALSLIGLSWFAFIGGPDYPSLLEQGRWAVLAPTAIVIVLGLLGVVLLVVRFRRA
jgi:carbon starvation protein CstA